MGGKQKYQRIIPMGEVEEIDHNDQVDTISDDDGDNNSTGGALSLDGASGMLDQIGNDPKNKKSKPQRHMPKRRGSHGSLASYRSLASADEEDFGNGAGFLSTVAISQSNSNDTTYEDAVQGDDDMMNDETAPFRGSFDQEDQQQQHDQPMSKQRPLAIAGNNHQSAIPITAEPNNIISYPASSLAFSGSFDLDDDDDDDEALRRYNIDFSRNPDTNIMTSLSHHGSSAGNDSPSSSNRNSPGPSLYHESSRSFSLLKYVWYSFQSVRQQARQRRAQRLLQQSERNFRQTLWICVMTYCDATDRGILLVASLMLTWSIVVYNVSNDTIRRWLLIVGICLLIIRFGARPFSEYLQRSRSRRRRLKELQQNQQEHHLQQQQQQDHHFRENNSNHRHNQQHLRLRTDSDDGVGAVTPPGRYLDQPLPSSHGSRSNDMMFVDTATSMENFELKSMSRRTTQNDSSSPSRIILPSKSTTMNITGANPPDPAIHTV